MSFTASRTCPVCGGDHAADGSCETLSGRAETFSGTVARSPPPVAQPSPTGRSTLVEAEDPLIGATFGSFKLTRRLGKGGMGSVYLGEHAVIGSKVAVKLLHSHLATNADLVSRFYAEARAVNLIGHENIVSIFDMNVVPPNQYYLVMEHLEGRPLAALADAPLDPKLAISILMQVCDGLDAAHARGVVHRDLKPENIFLIRRGGTDHFVKILDFGIAKLFAQGGGAQTGAGTIVGTPEYMSPEQCNGLPVDGRSDLYALGIIGYKLATGRLPFTEGGLTELLIAQVQQTPPPPREVKPDVPQEWSDIIMRALSKAPGARYPTARDMRRSLEAALHALEKRTAVTAVVPGAQLPFAPAPTPAPPAKPGSRTWDGTVRLPGSSTDLRVKLVDLSRGGVFVCFEAAPPPLLARVQLSLATDGGRLDVSAQVVSHVSLEQARGWGMSPGFGAQFLEVGPAVREGVARLLQGPGTKSGVTPRPSVDDAIAERTLELFKRRVNGDHYQLMLLERDAELDEVRVKGREIRRTLEALKQRPLSTRQEQLLLDTVGRISQAIEVLGTPSRRAEYDAQLNNFRGVARCIAAGLTVTELENLRKAFLQRRPSVETQSTIHGRTASAWESSGDLGKACEAYETALTVDPLNLPLQQRYWRLKRRVGPSQA